MSFLLDTDICSAHLKGNRRVFNRFMQYGGRLCVSAVTVAELYSWAYRAKTSPSVLRGVNELLPDVQVIDVDHIVAQKFGEVRAAFLDVGRPTPEMDLLIACTALCHGLALITHNLKGFVHVPGLRVDDWLG